MVPRHIMHPYISYVRTGRSVPLLWLVHSSSGKVSPKFICVEMFFISVVVFYAAKLTQRRQRKVEYALRAQQSNYINQPDCTMCLQQY